MVVLTEKFRFIRDDVFLCPWVDTKTGKQKLVMQKIDLETNVVEFEDSIDCIHTAVTDITLEEHSRFQNNDEKHEELLKETLFIRSSNELKEIHLSPEEKFKALKSWTAGIAEAGKDALSIQSEIDSVLGIWVQISSRLLSFMAKVDSDFIYEIIRRVEKECRFEGELHKSSMIANLLPIIWSFQDIPDEIQELESKNKKILSAILDLDPLKEIFYSEPIFFELLANNFPHIVIDDIIEDLGSDKTSQGRRSEDFVKLLLEISSKRMEDFHLGFKESIGEGAWKVLNFILENNLNILDAMNSNLYHDLRYDFPSVTQNLLNEARRKCTKKDVLNQDCFDKYLDKIAEWIYEKYNNDVEIEGRDNFYRDCENFYEYMMNEQEKEIIFTCLNRNLSSSLFNRFPAFFETLLVNMIHKFDIDKNENLIISLLFSDNPNFFEIIPASILKKGIPSLSLTKIPKLYLTKVNEMYGHNEEVWVKKCVQFLDLYVINPKYESIELFEGGYGYYIYGKNAHYFFDYNEILNFILKFQPPPTLFRQSSLFFKFLTHIENTKIQEIDEGIYDYFQGDYENYNDSYLVGDYEINNFSKVMEKSDQLIDLVNKATIVNSIGKEDIEGEEYNKALDNYNDALTKYNEDLIKYRKHVDWYYSKERRDEEEKKRKLEEERRKLEEEKKRKLAEEKTGFKIIDYHGTPLFKNEYDVLMALENIIGQIPAINGIGGDTFGFWTHDYHIVQLGLYNKNLTSLPESIGNLTSLTVLYVSNNKLSSLPESIGNLTSLKRLSLDENKLKSLPDTIGNLTSLTNLYLDDSELSKKLLKKIKKEE